MTPQRQRKRKNDDNASRGYSRRENNHVSSRHERKRQRRDIQIMTVMLILVSVVPLLAFRYHAGLKLWENPPTRSLAVRSVAASSTDSLLYQSSNNKSILESIDNSDASRIRQHPADVSRSTIATTRPVLESGWDEFAQTLYQNKVKELAKNTKLTVTLPGHDPVVVSYSTWWWTAFPPDTNDATTGTTNHVTRHIWERDTFIIFQKYITPQTIVVDFGMWIGPTILYNAPVAKHVYGIDADPVSFATAQRNVQLNHDQEWSHRITLEAACVSAPRDVGPRYMKSHASGDSMSGIADHISNTAIMQWKVQCYTLPDIFRKWGLTLGGTDPVFIKMDIESYECYLVPSLYDWLVEATILPTMYISFHNQIGPCSEEQWGGVLKVMKLYRKVTTGHGQHDDLGIHQDTTKAEFARMRKTAGVGPTFVLTSDKAMDQSDTKSLA